MGFFDYIGRRVVRDRLSRLIRPKHQIKELPENLKGLLKATMSATLGGDAVVDEHCIVIKAEVNYVHYMSRKTMIGPVVIDMLGYPPEWMHRDQEELITYAKTAVYNDCVSKMKNASFFGRRDKLVSNADIVIHIQSVMTKSIKEALFQHTTSLHHEVSTTA